MFKKIREKRKLAYVQGVSRSWDDGYVEGYTDGHADRSDGSEQTDREAFVFKRIKELKLKIKQAEDYLERENYYTSKKLLAGLERERDV